MWAQQVIALHSAFANVVRQRGEFQRRKVNTVQPQFFANGFRQAGNHHSMRLRVPFDAVGFQRQLQ